MKRRLGPVMVLAVLGVLVVSQGAGAASPARPASTIAQPTVREAAGGDEEFEFDEGEVGSELEECESGTEALEFEEEEGEGGFEEEELGSECGDQGEAVAATPKGTPSVSAPAACKIREGESKITVLPASDEVQLSVRYRAWSPTQVAVGVKLKGPKGSVAIAHTTKHVGAQGALHLNTKLGAALMKRALTASEFDVSLRAPETPGYCVGALDQRLHTVKRGHAGAGAARVYAG